MPSQVTALARVPRYSVYSTGVDAACNGSASEVRSEAHVRWWVCRQTRKHLGMLKGMESCTEHGHGRGGRVLIYSGYVQGGAEGT